MKVCVILSLVSICHDRVIKVCVILSLVSICHDRVIKVCVVLSLVSICHWYPNLNYVEVQFFS